VLCSRVRLEEKLIFQALRERGVEFGRIDVRRLVLDLADGALRGYDIVLNRCISHSRALYAAKILEGQGVRTLNTYEVIATCGDKIMTTMALIEHGVPVPHAAVAFDQASALAAIREAAEAVVEHHRALGAPHMSFYVQEYVDKPGRDVRALVVGEETVYAVYRSSSHWITNTARGGSTSGLPVSPEIDRLSLAAAAAVGGGIVAVDILEDADGALLVNEVNHTPEFHGALEATDVDVAGRMVDYILSTLEQ